MSWSSRGGDVIHWWEREESVRAVCGSEATVLDFFAAVKHCGPCVAIVEEVPPDLTDLAAVEAWLS